MLLECPALNQTADQRCTSYHYIYSKNQIKNLTKHWTKSNASIISRVSHIGIFPLGIRIIVQEHMSLEATPWINIAETATKHELQFIARIFEMISTQAKRTIVFSRLEFSKSINNIIRAYKRNIFVTIVNYWQIQLVPSTSSLLYYTQYINFDT